MPKQKKYMPSLRHMKYLEARLEGKEPYAAAAAAGYSKGGRSVAELEQHTELAKWFRECCATEGVTPELLVRKLREGLEANTARTFKSKVTETVFDEGSGQDVVRSYDEIIDKEYVDYETRHRYMMSAFELMGLNPRLGRSATTDVPDAGQASAGPVSVNIFQVKAEFAGMSEGDLMDMMQRRLLQMDAPIVVGAGKHGDEKGTK